MASLQHLRWSPRRSFLRALALFLDVQHELPPGGGAHLVPCERGVLVGTEGGYGFGTAGGDGTAAKQQRDVAGWVDGAEKGI